MLPVRFLRSFPLDALNRDAFFEPLRRMETMMAAAQPANLNVDVREENQRYVIEVDAPGYRKEDLDITIEEGVLTLTAKREQENKNEDAHYHLRERTFSEVSRSLRLPENADVGHIDAKLSDGVLTVCIAKTEEAKPHKIEVAQG